MIDLELKDIEAAALKLYCDNATIENEYKSMSFQKISTELVNLGFAEMNKSTIKRWADRFKFKEHLQVQIQTLLISQKDKSVEQKALTINITKKAVDITRNNLLTTDCYDILEDYVDQVKDFKATQGYITQDQVKIIKDIGSFTAGREDKLLDRLSDLGGDKLSSKQLLEQFATIEIDIEEDIKEEEE